MFRGRSAARLSVYSLISQASQAALYLAHEVGSIELGLQLERKLIAIIRLELLSLARLFLSGLFASRCRVSRPAIRRSLRIRRSRYYLQARWLQRRGRLQGCGRVDDRRQPVNHPLDTQNAVHDLGEA